MCWRPVLPKLTGVLLALLLCLAGCTSGGDQGQATAPSAPSPGSNARPSTTCWPSTRRPWSPKTATGCRPCSPRRRGPAPAAPLRTPAGLQNFGRLDPATGVLTRLGPTGFRMLFGVQFDPAFRTLYAITGAQVPPVLVALDPATGQGTAIAQTDLPTQAESLAFTADGRLVVAGGDGNLYELDPVTGASRLIGPTGVEVVSGMSLRVFPLR